MSFAARRSISGSTGSLSVTDMRKALLQLFLIVAGKMSAALSSLYHLFFIYRFLKSTDTGFEISFTIWPIRRADRIVPIPTIPFPIIRVLKPPRKII